MKILFATIKNPRCQGDLLEVSILNGLRSVIGDNCIDVPRKKVMYHDWSETTRDELHGRGFTLYTRPIKDIQSSLRTDIKNVDVVLYGVSSMYNEQQDETLNSLVGKNRVWFLDGHDLYGDAPNKINFQGEQVIGIQNAPCFKRELVQENIPNVYPTGFGIPSYQIAEINLDTKDQLYQRTAPNSCLFQPDTDLGNRSGYKFNREEDYFQDLQRSWFGLTCKRGGWDCLRHYEIIANGAVLLFKDYNKKPALCSPQHLPCLSYSTREELEYIMNTLIVNNKPTKTYLDLLYTQRQWLYRVGTTEARALNILRVLNGVLE